MRYYDYQHYYYYYTGRNYFSLLTTSEPGCKAGFWLPTWLHIRRKSTDSEPSYQLLITQCQVRHIRLPWGKNRSHPFTWTDRNSCYWRGFRLGSWVWLYTMTQTVAWFSSVVHSGPFWPPPSQEPLPPGYHHSCSKLAATALSLCCTIGYATA